MDKKLIHRLHVLNPLTNTDIIGNVLYFMVMKKTVLRQEPLVSVETVKAPPSIETKPQPPTSPSRPLRVDTNAPVNVNPPEADEPLVPASPSVSKLPNIQDPITLNQALHGNTPVLDPIHEEDESSSNADALPQAWTLAGPMTAEGAEDVESAPLRNTTSLRVAEDTTSTDQRRRSFKDVADTVSRRLSSVGPRSQGFHPMQDEENPYPKGIAMGPASAPPTSFTTGGLPRRTSAASVEYGARSLNRRNVKPGILSQHGEPINLDLKPGLVPPTAEKRRRSLSYMNTLMNSNTPFYTVKTWKKMLDDEKQKMQQPSGYVAERETTSTAQQLEPQKPTTVKEEHFYDAMLLATDTDFLESSRVRTLFRQNAVHPSDATLFEMPEFKGELNLDRPRRVDDSPMPCDRCFPTEAQLAHPNGTIRVLHQVRCYCLVVFTTMIIVFLIFYLIMSIKA
jgi:hypothetical protein